MSAFSTAKTKRTRNLWEAISRTSIPAATTVPSASFSSGLGRVASPGKASSTSSTVMPQRAWRPASPEVTGDGFDAPPPGSAEDRALWKAANDANNQILAKTRGSHA